MDKLSVLVADDDPKIRQLLNISLSQQNYVVYDVENGRQAIEFLEREIPNLVVLDLGMPVINGVEVCGWIRERGINIPIMVLTAYSGIDLNISVLDAGADEYMTKPFILEEFLARLRALIRRSAGPGSCKSGLRNST
ncbi:MAG: response regulator transcription factor [Aggregatilineales bacterium]